MKEGFSQTRSCDSWEGAGPGTLPEGAGAGASQVMLVKRHCLEIFFHEPKIWLGDFFVDVRTCWIPSFSSGAVLPTKN